MKTLEVVYGRKQYGRGNDDISDQFHAVADADCVRVWAGAHDDVCLVEVVISSRGRGKWKIGTSDCWQFSAFTHDKRFNSAAHAIEYAAYRNGAALIDATCRCGESGECD